MTWVILLEAVLQVGVIVQQETVVPAVVLWAVDMQVATLRGAIQYHIHQKTKLHRAIRLKILFCRIVSIPRTHLNKVPPIHRVYTINITQKLENLKNLRFIMTMLDGKQ